MVVLTFVAAKWQVLAALAIGTLGEWDPLHLSFFILRFL